MTHLLGFKDHNFRSNQTHWKLIQQFGNKDNRRHFFLVEVDQENHFLLIMNREGWKKKKGIVATFLADKLGPTSGETRKKEVRSKKDINEKLYLPCFERGCIYSNMKVDFPRRSGALNPYFSLHSPLLRDWWVWVQLTSQELADLHQVHRNKTANGNSISSPQRLQLPHLLPSSSSYICDEPKKE